VKILDLFSGTGSISNVFEEAGHEVFRIDFDAQFKTDWNVNVLNINAKDIIERFGVPDVIWASPPCTTFSVSSMGHHWENNTLGTKSLAEELNIEMGTKNIKKTLRDLSKITKNKEGYSVLGPDNYTSKSFNRSPKTLEAQIGLKILEKTLELIKNLNPKYYFIENPRGMMRKHPLMLELPRNTVTYCQYGDFRMKPTDIWTNNPNWIPRPMCKNGAPCHVAAPRGSITGTQGMEAAEKAAIPKELCETVLNSCNNL
jgi:site-specific DNA-cytosine methylase